MKKVTKNIFTESCCQFDSKDHLKLQDAKCQHNYGVNKNQANIQNVIKILRCVYFMYINTRFNLRHFVQFLEQCATNDHN